MSCRYHENDNYGDNFEEITRIKRQCIINDKFTISDFKNPLHCIPYVINDKDGVGHTRYSISEAYYKHLHGISSPPSIDSFSDEEMHLQELFEIDLSFPEPLQVPIPIHLPFPQTFFPHELQQKVPISNLRSKPIPKHDHKREVFRIKAKSLSRLHALKYYFSGIIPFTKPSHISEDEWSMLERHHKAGTLLDFKHFADGLVVVRSLPAYDAIVHSAVIYGKKHMETESLAHTRFRWWTDAKVVGFNPIQNLRKDGPRGGLRIIFPQSITESQYFHNLFVTVQYQRLGKAISDLLTMYIERLVGKDVYYNITVSGFKHHGSAIIISQPESPEIFKSLLLEYLLDKK